MAKKNTSGIKVEERKFDYKVELIDSSPIYSYSTNKLDNFFDNMKWLRRYFGLNLRWKVKVGADRIDEDFNEDNFNKLLNHYKDGNNVVLSLE